MIRGDHFVDEYQTKDCLLYTSRARALSNKTTITNEFQLSWPISADAQLFHLLPAVRYTTLCVHKVTYKNFGGGKLCFVIKFRILKIHISGRHIMAQAQQSHDVYMKQPHHNAHQKVMCQVFESITNNLVRLSATTRLLIIRLSILCLLYTSRCV